MFHDEKGVRDAAGRLLVRGDEVVVRRPSGSQSDAVVTGIPYRDRVWVRCRGASIDVQVPPHWLARPADEAAR